MNATQVYFADVTPSLMSFGGPFERQLGYALGAGLVWYVAFRERLFILLIYLCSITQTTLELSASDARMKVLLCAWYTPTSLGRISFPHAHCFPEGFVQSRLMVSFYG